MTTPLTLMYGTLHSRPRFVLAHVLLGAAALTQAAVLSY